MKKILIAVMMVGAMLMSSEVSAKENVKADKNRSVQVEKRVKKEKKENKSIKKEKKEKGNIKKGSANRGKDFNKNRKHRKGAHVIRKDVHHHHHHHHADKHRIVVHHDHCNGVAEAASVVIGIAALAAILAD